MIETRQATSAVKILPPSIYHREAQTTHHMKDVPPRSKLYGLEPREVGTLWGESLTSYLNRLGWRHGISPQRLVAQEVVPHVSNKDYFASSGRLAGFSRLRAVYLNGVSETSMEWSNQLERLTVRSDLRYLTLLWWIGSLPSQGLVRPHLAWCPLCYEEWKEKREPIYQPLVWTLRVVSMCMKHHYWLVDSCPICKKHQSAIVRETLPGHCTQCNEWLGTSLSGTSQQVLDKEMVKWQYWIHGSLEELLQASIVSGILSWRPFYSNLSAHDIFQTLFQLSGMPSILRWQAILEFCYICGRTPLQIMTNHLPTLEEFIERLVFPPTMIVPRPRVKYRVDIEECRNLLQAILNGDEELLTIAQVARRIGCSRDAIKHHFPQEHALITKRAKEFRKQRREKREGQIFEEIREAVFTLHAQGVPPSASLVAKMLSNPTLIRLPDALDTFHTARRDLGLER